MSLKQALIIVDPLKDFIEKDGALYCGEDAEKIISRIKKRLDLFRKENLPVIYLQDSHHEDDKEFEKFPKHCVKGTWGNEVVDELLPLEQEIVIPKTRFSGFYDTELENILQEIEPDQVVVTGVCTSICVMDTVGGLSNRDYKTIIPGDEVADFDNEMHEFSIKRMQNLYGAEII